jgi:hypothetical protein
VKCIISFIYINIKSFFFSLSFSIEKKSGVVVWAFLPYDPMDVPYIDSVLNGYASDISRVCILIASSWDAAPLLIRAEQLGVTGKGWTWVGAEWVREFTWIAAARPTLAALLNITNAENAAANTPPPPTDGGGTGDARRLIDTDANVDASGFDAFFKAASQLPPIASARERMIELATASAALRGSGRFLSSTAPNTGNTGAGSAFQPSNNAPVYIADDSGTTQFAMLGSIGVSPLRIAPHSVLGGYLDRFYPYQVSYNNIYFSILFLFLFYFLCFSFLIPFLRFLILRT